MSNTISFNQESFKNFNTEYNFAVENKVEIFTFEGHEFLTSYAKYMLEYLRPKFEKNNF
jgi:hypothetical protein